MEIDIGAELDTLPSGKQNIRNNSPTKGSVSVPVNIFITSSTQK